MKKRITALLLTLVMVLSLFPTTVFAVGRGTQIGGKETVLSWRANRRSSESGLQVTVTGSGLSGKELSVDVLKDAEAERYFNAIEAAGNKLVNPMALDIKILDNGSEWQPAGTVGVTITRQGASLSDKVYHFVPLTSIEPEGYGEDAVAEPAAEELTYEELASTTEGETATVTTRHFSVYIVGEKDEQNRLIVNFSASGSNVAQMYVKQNDDMETVVYEPSFDLPAGTIFKGWTTKADYTADDIDDAMTIEEVRSDITGKLPPENDAAASEAVTYYAMLFKQYKIDYLDPTGASMTQETIEYRADAGSPTLPYTINTTYNPVDDEHGFLGWHAHTGGTNIKSATYNGKAIDVTATDALYPLSTELTIAGDVVFAAFAPEGHWLVFNENGKGAKYNAPQFVQSDDVTVAPCDDNAMTCKGYTFGGWYETKAQADAHGANPSVTDGKFTFGRKLTDKTTIYASWIPVSSAGYTVIIWKQNVAGDGYDFEESVALTGTPGTAIDTVTSRGSGNDRYARVNNVNKQYDGFHLKEFDQNVTIDPQGGTVLNVYYDRNEYVLTFQVPTPTGGYTQTSNPTMGNAYVRVNGNYYLVELLDGDQRAYYAVDKSTASHSNTYYYLSGDGTIYPVAWRSNYGWWYYSGNYWQGAVPGDAKIYSRTSSYPTFYEPNVRWDTIYTITALYEQPIGDNFPIHGTNGVTYNNGERWDPQENNVNLNEVIVYLEIMPNGSVIFRLSTSSAQTKTMKYYVEALPGESVDRQFNGKNFHLASTQLANYNGVTVEDYIDMTGCNKFGVDPSYTHSNGNFTYYVDSEGSETAATTVNFFYTRKVFAVNYMDGIYVDGNGNPVAETSQGQLGTEANIAYGANISDKGSFTPSEDKTPAGYVLEGWYLDKNGTKAVEWVDEDNNPLTMPDGGITVYAKWRQIQYRVFLHPQAGTDSTLDWGSEGQAMNFRISYGGTVSLPTGLRRDYEFIGWYTDEACSAGKMFNADTTLNETTVTAAYNKSTDFTDPMDKWGNGATTNADVNRMWITKKLDLYAKWSPKLEGNASGIGVLYSLTDPDIDGQGTPGTGTGTASDTQTYKPETYAYAVPGVTAPTTGYKFDHWVMQKWDSNANAYVDVAGSVIYAGEEYLVSASNARIQTVDGITTYTIQLRAEYVKEDEPTPTFIPWFKNDGTAAFHTDDKGANGTDPLMINEGVNIQAAPSRDGYDFLGWAFVDMGSTAEAAEAFLANTANYTQTDLTIKVYYNSNNGKFYSDAAFTKEATQVAADEEDPYQAIFAVWQPKYFYIFHASSGDLEPVLLTGTIDLTAHVAGGKLYGGYYSAYGAYTVTDADKARAAAAGAAVNVTNLKYDGSSLKYDGTHRYWDKSLAGTVAGNAISASALSVGDVLYLKEVPATYLCSRISYVYDIFKENKLENLFLITAVDDNYYSKVAFKIVTDEEHVARITSTFTITQRNSTKKVTTNAGSFGLTRGYVGYVDVSSLLVEGSTFTMTPQWRTLDGVLVNGTPRTFLFRSLTPDGIQELTVTNP